MTHKVSLSELLLGSLARQVRDCARDGVYQLAHNPFIVSYKYVTKELSQLSATTMIVLDSQDRTLVIWMLSIGVG